MFQSAQTSAAPGRLLVVVAADIAVLLELTLGMYLGGRSPDNFTPVFLKTFLCLCVPTVATAVLALRRLDRRAAETAAEAA